MTKQELIEKLGQLVDGDPEVVHGIAERLLLEYINDPAVTEAFDNVPKWYS
jgi:hypothetical protein